MNSAQRLLAITGILVFAFLGAIQALYGPLLPGLQRAFSIDTSKVGLIYTAHGLGALSGIFVPSVVNAAVAVRRWLVAATGLLLLGSGALAVAPSWETTLAAVFLLAIGFGIHVIRLNSLFIASFGARGTTMSQLLNAAFSIGSILGPLMLGIVGAPSKTLFGPIAGAALLLLPMCLFADRAIVPVLPRQLGSARPNPARDVGLLCAFVALMSLVVGVENSIAGWTATLALANGFNYASAASLTAAFFGCIFAGRLVAAAIAHRVRPAVLVMGALLCMLLLLSLALFPRATPIAFVATGFALAPLFAGTLVWLGARLPTSAHANAFVIGGALMGSALYPPLVGRVIGWFGMPAAPPAVLGIALAAFGVGLWICFLRRS